jgi:hypothetical protein
VSIGPTAGEELGEIEPPLATCSGVAAPAAEEAAVTSAVASDGAAVVAWLAIAVAALAVSDGPVVSVALSVTAGRAEFSPDLVAELLAIRDLTSGGTTASAEALAVAPLGEPFPVDEAGEAAEPSGDDPEVESASAVAVAESPVDAAPVVTAGFAATVLAGLVVLDAAAAAALTADFDERPPNLVEAELPAGRASSPERRLATTPAVAALTCPFADVLTVESPEESAELSPDEFGSVPFVRAVDADDPPVALVPGVFPESGGLGSAELAAGASPVAALVVFASAVPDVAGGGRDGVPETASVCRA